MDHQEVVAHDPLRHFVVPNGCPSEGACAACAVPIPGDADCVNAQLGEDVMHCSCTASRAKHERPLVSVGEKRLNRTLKTPDVGVVTFPASRCLDQGVDGTDGLGFFGNTHQLGQDGLLVWHRDVQSDQVGMVLRQGVEVLDVGQVKRAVNDLVSSFGSEDALEQAWTLRVFNGMPQHTQQLGGSATHPTSFMPRVLPQR